jgi:23S rRNA pseudouridine1911/1915/1917 synthase
VTRPDYSEAPPLAGAAPPEDPDLAAEEADALPVDAAPGAGQRLDRFLAGALAGTVPGASRSRIQQWIALGAVWCEDRPLTQSTRLAGFERLWVRPLPRDADHAFAPDPVPLVVVDEDARLLVIDKPAGLVMHPAAGNWRGTLLNGLLHHRPELAHLPRAGIVHRLDKDTSGLLVVAKTESAVASLVGQLAERTMSRRYLAVVLGTAPAEGTVDAPLGRDPRMRTRMAVVEGPAGKAARTRFARLATWRLAGRPVSLVECRLETGRTHQIRVHMRHLGHPLLGDALYGGPVDSIGRQALHAWRLGLRDPDSGAPRRWVSLPPEDLSALAQSGGCDLRALCGEIDAAIRD